MKRSTKFLSSILILGILYSIYKLFNGEGGGGLDDFFDGLVHTSLLLFFASLTMIVFNIRHLKKQGSSLLFLCIGLPMTIMVAGNIIRNIQFNRNPDLTPKYERPYDQQVYVDDSLHIAIQIDSLVAIRNRNTGGIKVVSAFIDTIIYSQNGKEIFVSYAQQFEPNHLGNDLDPAYLFADEKGSVYWLLQEGTPNAEMLGGSFHDTASLKKAVRQFYFNQYSFLAKDSLKKNYFWKRN